MGSPDLPRRTSRHDERDKMFARMAQGRNDTIVADGYGSRVCIGAVSTDLPLTHDEPFSHRHARVHNLVRATIRRFSWSHRPALWLDDLTYGRDWEPRS